MSVILEVRDKKYEVEPGLKVGQAIHKIGLLPETYLATRDGEMITEDVVLKEGDQVRLIAVISGG